MNTITRRGEQPCMFCKKYAEFTVSDPDGSISQAIWDWGHGKGYVQDIKGLTIDQREILMSGTHPECWPPELEEEPF